MILSLSFRHGFSTKCIAYNTNCIGAVSQSNRIGTNTHCIVTNTLGRKTVTQL